MDTTDTTPGPASGTRAANATGNARLTGALGLLIFVLLFFEGLTILRVQRLMWLHASLGMLLIAFAAAKIGSTTYRFARYYSGQHDYVRKGPPHPILRILGPFVSLTTVALLATGVGALLDRHTRWLNQAHKASFILWFGAMTIHVLGHALETPALAFADWRRSQRSEAPGAGARLALVAAVVVVGLALALLSLRWTDHWQRLPGR